MHHKTSSIYVNKSTIDTQYKMPFKKLKLNRKANKKRKKATTSGNNNSHQSTIIKNGKNNVGMKTAIPKRKILSDLPCRGVGVAIRSLLILQALK